MEIVNIYPVRCTCSKPLAHLRDTYEDLLASGTSVEDALTFIGLKRYCCRDNMFSPAIVPITAPMTNYVVDEKGVVEDAVPRMRLGGTYEARAVHETNVVQGHEGPVLDITRQMREAQEPEIKQGIRRVCGIGGLKISTTPKAPGTKLGPRGPQGGVEGPGIKPITPVGVGEGIVPIGRPTVAPLVIPEQEEGPAMVDVGGGLKVPVKRTRTFIAR